MENNREARETLIAKISEQLRQECAIADSRAKSGENNGTRFEAQREIGKKLIGYLNNIPTETLSTFYEATKNEYTRYRFGNNCKYDEWGMLSTLYRAIQKSLWFDYTQQKEQTELLSPNTNDHYVRYFDGTVSQPGNKQYENETKKFCREVPVENTWIIDFLHKHKTLHDKLKDDYDNTASGPDIRGDDTERITDYGFNDMLTRWKDNDLFMLAEITADSTILTEAVEDVHTSLYKRQISETEKLVNSRRPAWAKEKRKPVSNRETLYAANLRLIRTACRNEQTLFRYMGMENNEDASMTDSIVNDAPRWNVSDDDKTGWVLKLSDREYAARQAKYRLMGQVSATLAHGGFMGQGLFKSLSKNDLAFLTAQTISYSVDEHTAWDPQADSYEVISVGNVSLCQSAGMTKKICDTLFDKLHAVFEKDFTAATRTNLKDEMSFYKSVDKADFSYMTKDMYGNAVRMSFMEAEPKVKAELAAAKTAEYDRRLAEKLDRRDKKNEDETAYLKIGEVNDYNREYAFMSDYIRRNPRIITKTISELAAAQRAASRSHTALQWDDEMVSAESPRIEINATKVNTGTNRRNKAGGVFSPHRAGITADMEYSK